MQPIEKQIINILSDRFTPEDLVIAVSMNLKSDLGFDSLDIMELIVVLETQFNIFISDQQAAQIQTVDDIIKLINQKMQRQIRTSFPHLPIIEKNYFDYNMNLKLEKRSGNACELCKSDQQVSVYQIPPVGYADNEIVVCKQCRSQIDREQEMNGDYWGFLSEAMWSEVPAVQVITWRMLSRLKNETWAADNLDMMYLDEDMLAWAQASSDHQSAADLAVHRDSNGNILKTGDTVVLTRSLDVKGSSLNARMGTVVKNIRVVEGNAEQIEGKIDGQLIVILTKYLRKQA